jgi:hypothetical protein
VGCGVMAAVSVSGNPNPSPGGVGGPSPPNQAHTSCEITITQRANCAGELLSSALYLMQDHVQGWGWGRSQGPYQAWEGIESRAAHPGSPNEVIARAVLSACQHNSPAASSPSARADQVSPRPTTLISRSRPAAANRRVVARLPSLAPPGRPAPLSVPQPREIGQCRTDRAAQPARPPHIGSEERQLPRLLLIKRFCLLSAAAHAAAAAAAAAATDHGWRTWCAGCWRGNFRPGSLLSELHL